MPLSIQPEILKRGSEVGEDVGSTAEAILTRIVALKRWTICFIINRATEAGRVAERLYGTRPKNRTSPHQKESNAARAAIIAVGRIGRPLHPLPRTRFRRGSPRQDQVLPARPLPARS